MKTNITKTLMAGLVLSAVTFYSCSKDDDNGTTTSTTTGTTDTTPVVLAVTPNYTTEAPQGGILKIAVYGTASEGNKIVGYKVASAETSSALDVTVAATAKLDTIWYVDSLLTSGTRNYTITLKGERGTPVTKTWSVNVLPAGHLDVASNAIPLFGQGNGAGSNANFISLDGPDFNSYSTSDFAANKTKVDLAFYWGNTNKATLNSPSDATMQSLYSGLDWAGVNTTMLYKTTLTATQFDDLGDSDSDLQLHTMAASVVTWTSSVNLLANGNVLLFKTAAGKLGLIKVNNVAGTTGVDGQIDLAIIAQQ